MKYAFIEVYRSEFTVMKMCEILNINKSGFYTWLDREPSCREMENSCLKKQIEEVFYDNRQVYGSPRIANVLRDMGHRVGENRVARLMQDMGISANIKKKFRPQTTDSNHEYPVSPNLLNQNFKVNEPNKIWLTDITYIDTEEGTAYLCAFKDLFNREIVGWTLETNMRKEMVIDALRKAVSNKNPPPGLIIHSDQGSQYASYKFKGHLNNHQFISSMSGVGNCYDNAPMESFFHTLKVEEVYRKKYKTIEEARRNIFDYISTFYNRKRKHSSLGYMNPVEYFAAFNNA